MFKDAGRILEAVPPSDEPDTAAELATRIAGADKPSKPYPKQLRLQWNVPRGVQPFIPLWLALLVIGIFVVATLV